jgi:hypothetical protein
MWKWLENLFYNKALITTELVEKDEALRQCYDAWMEDRSLLNGARLELKTTRKKNEELESLVVKYDNRVRAMENTKEEMQERIDELENEVYDLTIKIRNPDYVIGVKE